MKQRQPQESATLVSLVKPVATPSAQPPPPTMQRVSDLAPYVNFLKVVCILVTIVFALEKNVVTVSESIRSPAREFWRYVWVTLAGESDAVAFVGLTNLWGILTYWTFGLIYLTLDLTQAAWARRYKVQVGMNEPLDPVKLKKAIVQVLWNQFVVGVLLAIALTPLLRWRGVSARMEDLPELSVFFRHLAGYIVAEEVLFFYSHKAFHENPTLYRKFHKRHHEWTAPIGLTARYAHSVEDVVANLIPVMAGPILMGSHLSLWWIWIAVALFSTVTSHSGYHLPFLPSSEGHDAHHKYFNLNYGAFGLLDAVYGTDADFKRSVEGLRHRDLGSFVSARELVPDSTVVTE